MLPSEKSLEAAIDTLDAAAFQTLVEAYARKAFPARFARLAIHGRNPRGHTVAGWPDAYAVRADGKLDVIEATRDVRNWRTHFAKDVANVERLGPPGVGGFVLVAWAPAPKPETIEPLRRRLTALGIAASEISIIFRQQLVAELRQPQHAATWQDLLGLAVSALPFVGIADAPVFGSGEGELFAPTRAEFDAGAVHTPTLAKEIAARLADRRWVLVRGRGAAGKTVLATRLGLDWAKHGDPAYYLDLAVLGEGASEARVNTAVAALTSRAAHNVLFLVDNVHRDEQFAYLLFQQWELAGQAARLLLLGRDVAPGESLLGLESPLRRLPLEALRLEVGARDLGGTLKRLMTRYAGKRPATPPHEVLKKWEEVFAGDLIAFSAAVARRHPQPPDWPLDAADARDYMSGRYLARLSHEEREALLGVAAWSTLELPRPESMTDSGRLRVPLREGLVERYDAGYRGFRTIHPGVGELLLAAAGERAYPRIAADSDLNIGLVAAIAVRLNAGSAFSDLRDFLAASVTSWATVLQAALELRARTFLYLIHEHIGVALASLPLNSRRIAEMLSGVDNVALCESLELVQDGIPELIPAVSRALNDLPSVRGRLLSTMRRDQKPPARFLGDDEFSNPLPTWYEDMVKTAPPDLGLQGMFITTPRLTVRDWDSLIRVSAARDGFSRELHTQLSEEYAPGLRSLLSTPDAPTVVRLMERRDPMLCASVVEGLRHQDNRTSVIGAALSLGPTTFRAICEVAMAYDQDLGPMLLDAAADADWEAAVSQWRGEVPFSLLRLCRWSEKKFPALFERIGGCPQGFWGT